MAITETWLKAQLNKPRSKVEEFADRDGMSVRLSLKGKIVFQIRYRLHSKPCRYDIGSYPAISLKDARATAINLREYVQKGIDPRTVNQEDNTPYTLIRLFTEWYERYCVHHKTQHKELKRSFEIHVFPFLGLKEVDNITSNQWLKLLEDLSRTKPSIAKRILINTKQMCRWGVKRELIKYNVLADITVYADLHIKDGVGDRVLNDNEISIIFGNLDKSNLLIKNKLFLKLLLIYGCRVSELRLAKKEDFNFNTMVWTVPVANHKQGKVTNKPLIRPITDNIKPYLILLFELSKSDYLFPTNSNEPLKQGSHRSMVTNLMSWLKKEGYVIEDWSVHDLRRTMRTSMASITEPHIAEMMIGHTIPKIWRTYDKYDYLEEQALAYSKWVDKLKLLWGDS